MQLRIPWDSSAIKFTNTIKLGVCVSTWVVLEMIQAARTLFWKRFCQIPKKSSKENIFLNWWSVQKRDGELAQWLRTPVALPEAWACVSAPIAWLTGICSSSSRGIPGLLPASKAPGPHVVYIHTCMQNTHLHKKKSFKSKLRKQK